MGQDANCGGERKASVNGGCCGSGGSCSCGAGCGNNNNYSGRGDDVGEVPSKAALLYTSGELQSSLNCT